MSLFGIQVEAVPTPDQRFKPSSAMVGFPSANSERFNESLQALNTTTLGIAVAAIPDLPLYAWYLIKYS